MYIYRVPLITSKSEALGFAARGYEKQLETSVFSGGTGKS